MQTAACSPASILPFFIVPGYHVFLSISSWWCLCILQCGHRVIFSPIHFLRPFLDVKFSKCATFTSHHSCQPFSSSCFFPLVSFQLSNFATFRSNFGEGCCKVSTSLFTRCSQARSFDNIQANDKSGRFVKYLFQQTETSSLYYDT